MRPVDDLYDQLDVLGICRPNDPLGLEDQHYEDQIRDLLKKWSLPGPETVQVARLIYLVGKAKEARIHQIMEDARELNEKARVR